MSASLARKMCLLNSRVLRQIFVPLSSNLMLNVILGVSGAEAEEGNLLQAHDTC